MTTNILLSGVGGQGIITASKVLSEAALVSGFHIKKSEVHGMSQRGGSVESHVRYSRDGLVYSPLIPAGKVDILLAFELLEALRAIPVTSPEALVLVEDREMVPTSVIAGPFSYPTGALDRLYAGGRRIHPVNSFEIAVDLGEPRAANIVMLGAASSFMDIEPDAWTTALRRCMKPKALDTNLKAFQAGIDALSGE